MLGVNTTVNIGYLLVASMLSENGLTMKITPAHSASAVMLPGDPLFPFPASQPLVDGKVAAAVMSEPFATELAQQYGANIIANTDSGATSQFPILGYATTKALGQGQPEHAQGVRHRA